MDHNRLVRSIMSLLIAGCAVATADDKPLSDAKKSALKKQIADARVEWIRLTSKQQYKEGLSVGLRLLELRQQLYPPKEFSAGHHELVESHIQLSQSYRISLQAPKAREHAESGLAMARKIFVAPTYPDGHPSLALAHHALAKVEETERKPVAAVRLYEQAIAIFEPFAEQKEFPSALIQLADCRLACGFLLLQQQKPSEAAPHLAKAADLYQKLFPDKQHPNGHAAVEKATSLAGEALLRADQPDRAAILLELSLAHTRKLYPRERFPNGGRNLPYTLVNLGGAYHQSEQHAKAVPVLEESLELSRRLFPPEQFPDGADLIASAAQNLAASLVRLDRPDKATAPVNEAVTLFRKLAAAQPSVDRELRLASMLNNAGLHREKLWQTDDARHLYREGLAIYKKLAGTNQLPPDALSLMANLVPLLAMSGDFNQARELGEQALATARQLFPVAKHPDGHRQIVSALNALIVVQTQSGQLATAAELSDESLRMSRKLYPKPIYPNGHTSLVDAINNRAVLSVAEGEDAAALRHAREAVDMYRLLYPRSQFPKGESSFAKCLAMYALQLLANKQHADAFVASRESLEMVEQLFPSRDYPDGHPLFLNSIFVHGQSLVKNGKAAEGVDLMKRGIAIHDRLANVEKSHEVAHSRIVALSSLGEAELASGEAEKAVATLERAQTASLKRLELFAAMSAEADVWQMSTMRPVFFHDLLTAARSIAGGDARAYSAVWSFKAGVSQLLQNRHESARVLRSKSEPARKTWDELHETRRQIASILLTPTGERTERGRRLDTLIGRRDDLERKLSQLVPAIVKSPDADRPTVERLVRDMPAKSAFLDFVRYLRRNNGDGKPEERYAVFVLLPTQAVQRIELGDATTIDAAIVDWRRQIELRRGEPRAKQFAELLWKPIARVLPTGIRTLYLAPDGDLARVPWCALPGREPGTVLLEDFAGGIGIVPHGPYLANQVRRSAHSSEKGDRVMLLGGVTYGAEQSFYTDLPGTKRELAQVEALAGGKTVRVLDGEHATSKNLLAQLSTCDYAHLATHGFFAEQELANELSRQSRLERTARRGLSSQEVMGHAGAKSPLAYTGLALAGANRRGAEGRGIITGESIVGMSLGDLRLCVLSACETGLGLQTQGEGVFGLTRAFHLAGCPTVVASLWKVNDAATAALMAKFYHELWVNKKPPIEALREAQLTIYRHPELIPDLAGERGAPKLKDAVSVKPAVRSDKAADTKLWAAFVLSGVGN